MYGNDKITRKLFALIFVFSISIPTALCGVLNLYGYYGEIKSSVIVDDDEIFSDVSVKKTAKEKAKNKVAYNIWLILLYIVVLIKISACIFRLPREDTIVFMKVRMNN